MAKNYTLKEVVEIISAGTDVAAIMEIGKRFPLLAILVARMVTLGGRTFVEFINCIPDHVTANKANAMLKTEIPEDEDDADDTEAEEVEDTPVPEKKPAKKEPKKAKREEADEEENDNADYSKMSGSVLWELLGKHNLRKDCKAKMGGVKKAQIVEYLEKYGLDGNANAEDETEAEETPKKKPVKKAVKVEAPAEETETETEAEDPYAGMTSRKLFEECKNRGIKVKPKQDAEVYRDLLVKDDESKKQDGPEDWEDDGDEPWDDEPAKTEKKPVKKAPTKKAKKPEPAEEDDSDDDDEDWDI